MDWLVDGLIGLLKDTLNDGFIDLIDEWIYWLIGG